MSRNGVIGKKGRLPWSIPEDFSYFLEAVKGDVCITGRRSYAEFGCAIPSAGLHIVLSKQQLRYPDALVQPSLQEALQVARMRNHVNVWIAGGTSVYRESFALADELWATHVHADVEGDVYFPAGWQEYFTEEVSRRSSSDSNFQYDFVVY
ncbi:folA, partial [Symbiodinium pilosum]